MTISKITTSVLIIFVFSCLAPVVLLGQNSDRMPVREYTNPDEVVTFDRSISFSRALDVFNEFSQEYRGKMIIDRTGTEGNIGISIPSMHWMDALETILRVKQLRLVEQEEFYEIVFPREGATTGGQATASGEDGEGPAATIDTREVRINAIFFEGNRRALQEVGVDWSTLTNNVPDNVGSFVNEQQGGQGGGGGGQGGQGGQSQGQLPAGDDFIGPFVSVNSKGAQDVSQNVFNSLINLGEIGNTGIRVQALFSAFEADNLGEILASPTIKVVDGQEGRIQVGQDFSIKQRDFAGNVVEEFFSVGTILTVTPQIITHNDTTFIHLDIDAERSSAQPDPVSTIINKQQAETEALLLDDEATILAGLYRTEKTEVRRGVPILKDLPPWFFGLKYLFGYNSQDYQMRELVVLLQASIEPSIQDRYDKPDTRNKFEIIQDERDRFRQDIRDSQRELNNEGVMDDLEGKNTEDPDSLTEDTEQPEPEDNYDKNQERDSPDEQRSENQVQQEKEETPRVRDPEVEVKSVEIAMDEEEDRDDQNKTDTSVTEEETDTPARSESTEAEYYIIAGSFSVQQNAVDLQNELQNKGYNSTIIQKSGSSMQMVTFGGYDDFGVAQSQLSEIQTNENPDAWLYRSN
ncbi:SPOR domain-containing protein [Aliifodinibius salicampi]|uniref:SPOR domain-containing protein n=1 Tax=Fodinibius salicampi TaxID=1920655 RepID=A0ABT3PV86_9BACT|nr:SPOR domain-containing protein [Fodinibius salicampi]MCW9711774.1 SPOR domain-containing protein [Fodinibius salicampi]